MQEIARAAIAEYVSDRPARIRVAKTRQARRADVGELVVKGDLEAVWMPDERCGIVRRRLSRREQLTCAHTRAKNAGLCFF